jgi:hypothetical protein
MFERLNTPEEIFSFRLGWRELGAGATDGTLKHAVERVIETLSHLRRVQRPNLVLDESSLRGKAQ